MEKELKEGQLCWFCDYNTEINNKKSEYVIISVFDYTNSGGYFKLKGANLSYRYCRPLTKAEIKKFMELAE